MLDQIIMLILTSILSSLVYLLANYHTYTIGTQQNEPVLKDVFFDLLPDLSKYPYIRDIALVLCIIPFLYVHDKLPFILETWNLFLIIVTLKAICIFFTFIPPSNTVCHKNIQNKNANIIIKLNSLNHTYHQIFSGHNSFVFLVYLMYIKYGLFNLNCLTILPVICYSLLILMTRCHYTVDIIISYIIVYLLV